MYRHRIDAPTVAELRESAIELLRSANCPNVLIEIFNNSMDIILAIDNSLGYFVLFCTVQIEAESLLNSIYRGSLNQHLIAGHSKNYIDVIPGNSIFCQNEVPWLPWDITSALEDLTVSNHSSKPKYIYDDNAEAGQLSQSFTTILASQKLRLSASRYKPRSLVLGNDSDDEEILTFYTFSPSQMLFDLVVMYEGHSSDLFQKTHNEHFFLCENCEIKDKDLCWQLKESASLLEPHVNSANRLLQLKNNPAFVRASGAKKSISSICEKQLSAISKIMHDKASNYNNLVLLLQNFLDTARDMERMLQFCITILTTCESLYDLSAAIRKMYLLTNEKQYKILLNDFNKAVVLDLSTYLTQPDSAIPLESYIKLFFGASTEGKKLSRLPEEIFKDDIMREITTTMRIAKKMKDSLHSTEDYDQHYAESLKLSTYFKNLEEILTDMDSLGLPRMLHYILKPFSSQKIIDALVVDFKEAMKLIALVFLPLSNHRMLHENEITPKNLLSYGISRRHISRLILGKGILLYDAPPPLDLIISEQHSARYSHIREQFILLSSAYKALLEINLRNNLFCPGEDRIAFFRRNNMISIVRSLLNHVVSMVRIIKIEMEVKLKKVGSVSDLVTIQRHVIRHLFQRIRLETKNTSTSRIITLIADHVHIFSAAFTQGDARSCDIHYSNFSDCIRVLSEKLGTETDNNYAKMLLVQFDRWGFVNSRRSESCSTSRSFISLEDSTSS